MPTIDFPLSTAPGINPTESGGRLINGYVEKAPAGSRGQYIWRASAGLRTAFAPGTGEIRGALKFGSTMIVIVGDTAYSVISDYTYTALTGTVPGTGPVIMARNMRGTPQIMVIHSAGMTKIESGACTDFTDADLPAPNSVTYFGGYFIFGIGDGRMFASGLNDITVASTDYATAEAKPDGIVRVIGNGPSLLAMGETSTEFYSNTGNATGFPLSFSSVIPVGLVTAKAVAGFEEGFTDQVIFVANDRTVKKIVGYEAVTISEPDLNRLIEQVADVDDLEASVYISSGNQFFVLSSADWTWELNLATGQWNERKSLGLDRWRAHFGVNCFDQWFVADTTENTMYRVDPTYRREGDEQLVWEVRSTQAHRFPGRAEIKRASFDIRTGVGIDAGADTIETDPVAMISWSDDGGVTFKLPLQRRLGTQGEITNIDIFKAGVTGRYGRQWKIVIADPVSIALYGAAMDINERAA
jgi:hypothetical protein